MINFGAIERISGSKKEWEWFDDFEDGDIDDTWAGWSLGAGSVIAYTLKDGTGRHYATSVDWTRAEFTGNVSMKMRFNFKTAPLNAWTGTNAFCEIRVKKGANWYHVYLKERILSGEKKYSLSLVGANSTGYKYVLDYTSEADEIFVPIGYIQISVNSTSLKAAVKGLISGEVDMATTSDTGWRVLGASSLHAYAGGSKTFGVVLDEFYTVGSYVRFPSVSFSQIREGRSYPISIGGGLSL